MHEDTLFGVDSAKTQGSTFRAKVDVVEWLGNEAFAYIPFEAPPEVQEQLAQLERDLDGESLRTQLVVSLDSASRIKEGDEAEIYVDRLAVNPAQRGRIAEALERALQLAGGVAVARVLEGDRAREAAAWRACEH